MKNRYKPVTSAKDKVVLALVIIAMIVAVAMTIVAEIYLK
jgi:hypothetical protein